MAEKKRKTKIKDKSASLTDKLDPVSQQCESNQLVEVTPNDQAEQDASTTFSKQQLKKKDSIKHSKKSIKEQNREVCDKAFDRWEGIESDPPDFVTDVPIDSLESKVGYSSLLRQMHRSFVRTVAFHRSQEGGSLSIEEARAKAFHACTNQEEAKKIFNTIMSLPLDKLNFVDLMELQSYSPRVAEMFWEMTKLEGRAEFESGHLAANITFPVGYMKQVWNIARYLGVRESFLEEWKPRAGVEVAMIDMLTQTYFQWQYWLEQTVKRTQTEPRREHHQYQEWKKWKEELSKANSWESGYWFPPYVHEQQAIEHAVQMADRFNRIFMRTLRQLRDLRRYSPVTINNPTQVNIATDGGQQINLSE